MTRSEIGQFTRLITDVLAFYRQDCSEFATMVWWQAMQPFDFSAVADALNRHCVDPDRGQFAPKPADVVRLLRGGGKDSAAIAWAKTEKAIRCIGSYTSVAFDDPLIHACVDSLGGWVSLCQSTEQELPHVARRFETLYQGYRGRADAPNYPPVLIGQSESENAQRGFKSEKPTLIGNPEKAKITMQGGKASGLLQITDSLGIKQLGLAP